MIRYNGRILAASASTLLLVATACAPADAPEAGDEGAAVEGPAGMEADAAVEGDGDAMAVDGDVLIDPNEAEGVALAGAGLEQGQIDAILARRPFADMTALDALLAETMDGTAREDLYERVWIPVDVNAASREEILLIPGVGERMAREVLEYRPYDAIERFRREIGKYVDDEEIARLERYIVIR
jgi:hypothetical protein